MNHLSQKRILRNSHWLNFSRVGRPKVSAELRTLIGEMSRANALWGAPRSSRGEEKQAGFASRCFTNLRI
jgi:hypothetical protein